MAAAMRGRSVMCSRLVRGTVLKLHAGRFPSPASPTGAAPKDPPCQQYSRSNRGAICFRCPSPRVWRCVGTICPVLVAMHCPAAGLGVEQGVGWFGSGRGSVFFNFITAARTYRYR